MAVDKTPAYPRTGSQNLVNEEYNTLPQEGMYIVDVFAAEAFKSIYPTKAAKATVEDPVNFTALATECYTAATAMIAARNAYLNPDI